MPHPDHLMPLGDADVQAEPTAVRLRQRFTHRQHPDRTYLLAVGGGSSPHLRQEDGPDLARIAFGDSALMRAICTAARNGTAYCTPEQFAQLRDALLQDRDRLLDQAEYQLSLDQSLPAAS